jgi:hypothetical protein
MTIDFQIKWSYTVGNRLLCCFVDKIWVALHRHHNINIYIYIYIHIQTLIRSHYHLITCIYWRNSLRHVTIHIHLISFFFLLLLLQYTNRKCLLSIFLFLSFNDYDWKDLGMNTQNIYLAFVRLEYEEKERRKKNARMTVSIGFFFFLLHTRVRLR